VTHFTPLLLSLFPQLQPVYTVTANVEYHTKLEHYVFLGCGAFSSCSWDSVYFAFLWAAREKLSTWCGLQFSYRGFMGAANQILDKGLQLYL